MRLTLGDHCRILASGGFAILLAACGSLSDEEVQSHSIHRSTQPRVQVTSEGVDGVWSTGCVLEDSANGLYQIVTIEMLGGEMPNKRISKKIDIYRDSNCQWNLLWQREYQGEYQLDLDQLKQRYTSLTITPRDGNQTAFLNMGAPEHRYCKFNQDYQLNVAVTIAPIDACLEMEEKVTSLDLFGVGRGQHQELFFDHLKLRRSR